MPYFCTALFSKSVFTFKFKIFTFKFKTVFMKFFKVLSVAILFFSFTSVSAQEVPKEEVPKEEVPKEEVAKENLPEVAKENLPEAPKESLLNPIKICLNGSGESISLYSLQNKGNSKFVYITGNRVVGKMNNDFTEVVLASGDLEIVNNKINLKKLHFGNLNDYLKLECVKAALLSGKLSKRTKGEGI